MSIKYRQVTSHDDRWIVEKSFKINIETTWGTLCVSETTNSLSADNCALGRPKRRKNSSRYRCVSTGWGGDDVEDGFPHLTTFLDSQRNDYFPNFRWFFFVRKSALMTNAVVFTDFDDRPTVLKESQNNSCFKNVR